MAPATAPAPPVAGIRAWAEATSPEVIGIPSSTTGAGGSNHASATGKAMTRAQARSKKSHALAESVAAAPTLELGPVDTSTLSEATLTMCAAYRPTGAVRPTCGEATSWPSGSSDPAAVGASGQLLRQRRRPVPGLVSRLGRAVAAPAPGPSSPSKSSSPPASSSRSSASRGSGREAPQLRSVDSLDPAPRRTKLAYHPARRPTSPAASTSSCSWPPTSAPPADGPRCAPPWPLRRRGPAWAPGPAPASPAHMKPPRCPPARP